MFPGVDAQDGLDTCGAGGHGALHLAEPRGGTKGADGVLDVHVLVLLPVAGLCVRGAGEVGGEDLPGEGAGAGVGPGRDEPDEARAEHRVCGGEHRLPERVD